MKLHNNSLNLILFFGVASLFISASCQPPKTVPEKKADLVISGFVITPSSPYQETAIQATIDVANAGNASAGSFSVEWRPNETQSGIAQPVTGLEPGQNKTLTFDFVYTGSGTFQSVARVDIDNSVPEGDAGENNNRKDLRITIRPNTRTEFTTTPKNTPPLCPKAVTGDKDMNNGADVDIKVTAAITGRNEVTVKLEVVMQETGGSQARGVLSPPWTTKVRVPNLDNNFRISKIKSDPNPAACFFHDENATDRDDAKCDIIKQNGFINEIRIMAQAKGHELDCDDGPYKDSTVEVFFRPIKVEVRLDEQLTQKK